MRAALAARGAIEDMQGAGQAFGEQTPVGERRGRFYRAAAPLTQIRQASRSPRRIDDPYEIAAKRQKPDDQEEARLPGF